MFSFKEGGGGGPTCQGKNTCIEVDPSNIQTHPIT